ncbi:hypothetical protein HDV06_004192 [Boothiomyces sp. JEL0866]|nr:hypothetical protein HDV06_004192 [Boothiomyces sp. JEL0866]
MADIESLYQLFESFCQFGSTRNLNGGSLSNLKGPEMDNAKWAKFTRDCKLLDKTITSTECDIIFNKIKVKTERKINFDHFQECLRLIAAKKYSSKTPTEAYVILCQNILNSGRQPVVQSSVNSNAQLDVTARLTDPSQYTGRHKAQHSELEKSKSTSNGNLSSSTRNSQVSMQKNFGSSSKLNQPTSGKRGYNSTLTPSVERLDNLANQPKKADFKSSLPKLNEKSNVYDRLTDAKGYTGSHKHRFDEHGNGRGLDGRDSTPKGSGSHGTYRGGNVNSLSQILRN